jgi:hypothetical protein
MYVITITKHELSEDHDCVLVHFAVNTTRPTDNRKVRAGAFMLFLKKGEETDYAVGTEYILARKNDIIQEENTIDVSCDSTEEGFGGTVPNSRTI